MTTVLASVLSLGLFLPVSVFAQTKPVTSRVASAPKAKTLLEQARESAQKDYDRVSKELELEFNKIENYDACHRVLLSIQKSYDRWFLDYYSAFQALSETIDQTLVVASAKLNTLRGTEITVNPLPGQTGDKKVSFQDLVRFFKIYNGRLKGCSKDSKDQLVEDMKSPEFNPLGLGQAQVEEAMKLMTQALNTSLKQSGTAYEITMNQINCEYRLDLLVTVGTDDQKQEYRFTLLGRSLPGAALDKIELGDGAKWSALTQASKKLAQNPVDGLLRYRQMQIKMKDKCSNLPELISYSAGVPFLTYDEAKKSVSELKARGVRGALMDMEFVILEPGSFTMGSPTSDDLHYNDEVQHPVTLTKGFEIAHIEVTQASWFEVMGSNPSIFKNRVNCLENFIDKVGGICPNHPVENTTYDDIQIFLDRLNRRSDGYRYRLPTEAEWEYAARGGEVYAKQYTAYSFGDDPTQLNSYGWNNDNSTSQTHDVGTKLPSPIGLYDIHGNVLELCSDFIGDYSGDQDPKGPATGTNRVVRGGSYDADRKQNRSAYRSSQGGSDHSSRYGFRLVREAI